MDDSDVRSLLSRFAEALSRGDAVGAAACFAPDATYSEPPRFAFAGREAIAAFFADFTARHREVSFAVARVLEGNLTPQPPSHVGKGEPDSPLRRGGEGPGERLAAAEWRFAYTSNRDGARTVFEGMSWVELAPDGLIARWRGFSARVAS